MAKWFLKFASYIAPNDIFDAVKSGKKMIETRPRNKKSKRDYSSIKPGDTLVMQSNETRERIEKKVVFVHLYVSIKELAENELVEKIFPGVQTPNELVLIFEDFKKKWGRRYAEKLDKYGVVAIGFK